MAKSPDATRASNPDHRLPKPSIRSATDLLKQEKKDQPWIIENLLKHGGQMVLSAAPKTGKSYLAQQIALSLSLRFEPGEIRYLFDPDGFSKNGRRTSTATDLPFRIFKPADQEESDSIRWTVSGQFPAKENPNAHRAWKVLFVSLEMKDKEIAGRLRQQLTAFGFPVVTPPAETPAKEPDLNLDYCFGIEKEASERNQTKYSQNLSVLTERDGELTGDTMKDLPLHAQVLAQMFEAHAPDVVVYDTLIQLHSINENDNVMMKALMSRLRVSVRPRTT